MNKRRQIPIANPEIYLNFFSMFSRLEAVWQSYTHLYDWGRFSFRITAIAEELKQRGVTLDVLIEKSASIKYLHEHPPKKQFAPNQWKEYEGHVRLHGENFELSMLLEKMRIVRNNLFHGGKWSNLPENQERDFMLITACIDLIDVILDSHPEWDGRFLK